MEPGSDEALTEKFKASVRAKVEHPFLRVKRAFGYGKVRYRGLAKNTERLALLFGLGNLLSGGESTDRVRWAQWAPTRTQAPGRAAQSPQESRWREMAGRKAGGNGPRSRGIPRNLTGSHRKSLGHSCSEYP